MTIQDNWMGLSEDAPLKAEWTIDATRDGYRLHGKASKNDAEAIRKEGKDRRKVTASADTPVPAASVDALLSAMQAPAQDHLDVINMAVNQDAAQAYLDKRAALLQANMTAPALATRIATWRKGLHDPVALGKVLASGLKRSYHTDDYPNFSVTVTMSDGSKLVACSSSQNAMMLPWEDAGIHYGQGHDRSAL